MLSELRGPSPETVAWLRPGAVARAPMVSIEEAAEAMRCDVEYVRSLALAGIIDAELDGARVLAVRPVRLVRR